MKGTLILTVLLNLWITSLAQNCKVVPGKLKQIDVGNGQVFGVNSDNDIYTLYRTSWTQLPGSLKHVSVGPAGVWGVNSKNEIYKLVKGDWVIVQGLLKQIDAGGNMFVAGANMHDDIFCLNGDATMNYQVSGSTAPWVHMPGKLKYYSCGPYSCWGVNAQDDIYIMKEVSSKACGGSLTWEQVPGGLSMIEVSTDGQVYGVNSLGDIYQRDGVSQCNPTGTGWHQIPHPHKAKHVSYDLGHLWVIDTDDTIEDCTILRGGETGSSSPAISTNAHQLLLSHYFTRTRKLKITKGTRIVTGIVNDWITSLAQNCKVVPGKLKQIDVGNGQVFGVNSNDDIYTLYGTSWTKLPGSLMHVSVGPAGVWGVNSNNEIYKLVKGDWVNVQGLLKQIDAGGNMFIAGVNMHDDIFCLNGDATMNYKVPGRLAPWVQIPGLLKYYSCGPYSCWGVNAQDDIYIMKGVSPTVCGGSLKWEQVPGSLSMIEVSTDGHVYGVNSLGDIYQRDGVSQYNPTGTGWHQIPHPQKAKHVSYDLGHLWVIGTDDTIVDCTM